MTATWLAFDVGTTGTKTAVIGPDGRIIRSAYREYQTRTAAGGVMEQDAEDWWRAVAQTATELDAGSDVGAVVVTGQMQDVVLLDSRGTPVRPVILHSDTRAHREVDEVADAIGPRHLRTLTGNTQDATGLLAKLRWLDRHEPAAADATASLFLGAADYVTWRLTGTGGSDTTTASTTGLMNLATRTRLADSVLESAGLGEWADLIPPMRAGGESAGRLTEGAARALRLPAGLPVHHGPGDTGAAAIGGGGGWDGGVCVSIGTSGWIATTADTPAEVGQAGVITLAHPTRDRYFLVALLITAGANLAWARQALGGGDYPGIIDIALSRESSDLLYFPYLDGARSPFQDPRARGAFVGLSSRTETPDLYRAVLEGVVFAYRECVESLRGDAVRSVTLIGGGARSPRWNQLFADILGVEVSVSADAEFAGLRGAVMAAQAALGDGQALKVDRVTFEPRAGEHDRFEDRYRRYQQLYPHLRVLFG